MYSGTIAWCLVSTPCILVITSYNNCFIWSLVRELTSNWSFNFVLAALLAFYSFNVGAFLSTRF